MTEKWRNQSMLYRFYIPKGVSFLIWGENQRSKCDDISEVEKKISTVFATRLQHASLFCFVLAGIQC